MILNETYIGKIEYNGKLVKVILTTHSKTNRGNDPRIKMNYKMLLKHIKQSSTRLIDDTCKQAIKWKFKDKWDGMLVAFLNDKQLNVVTVLHGRKKEPSELFKKNDDICNEIII